MYDWILSRKQIGRTFLIQAGVSVCLASSAVAQHPHDPDQPDGRPELHWGARGVGLVTKATPAILNQDLTEGYLTQPSVTAMASVFGGRLSFNGMLNLEGLSLKRGELNHGVWGEGYIDRRHPHTYLHEAVLTLQESVGRSSVSLSAGRGFAPFGTDDPMVRPFVKYPVNHHLSQILERYVAIAAVRHGPVTLEAARFNGDEPTGPGDLGRARRFGDSWSGRATLRPVNAVELQASFARVESPEQPNGGGLNQNKQSYSARVEAPLRSATVYGLIERARTGETHGGAEVFVFTSVLAETSVALNGWSVSARFENSTRPEEERTQDLFRSVRPSTDNSILGTTRWRTWTVGIARSWEGRYGVLAPFVEASRAFAKSNEQFSVYTPEELYGNDRIWNLSAGIRLSAGMHHDRMGRYGASK